LLNGDFNKYILIPVEPPEVSMIRSLCFQQQLMPFPRTQNKCILTITRVEFYYLNRRFVDVKQVKWGKPVEYPQAPPLLRLSLPPLNQYPLFVSMNAVTTPHAKREGANELFIDFL